MPCLHIVNRRVVHSKPPGRLYRAATSDSNPNATRTVPALSDEQKLERKITRRFQKALTTYRLIDDGDHVLVGLSGGKDSLCLLELLAKRMKITRPSFRITALHVRMENIDYLSDTSYLETFAGNLGVPLRTVTTRFDENAASRKPACFLCSWHRRKQMFRTAQDLGCNKLALGHHMDDIIHTAMMNQFFQGHFSAMPVRLALKKMPLTIIRPLCLEEESDIEAFARLRGYGRQLKVCPFERDSQRTAMRDVFTRIEAVNPEARYSFWNALEADGKLTE